MTTLPQAARTDASTAWRTALAVLALGAALSFVGRGLAECFVVFVLPLAREFGWERGAVMSIPAIAVVSTGIAGPLAGRAFDRCGPRLVFSLGLALAGTGMSLAAFADKLWQLQLCLGVAVGLGAACLGTVPNAALMARWFRARLSLAMSGTFAGAGAGILVMVPLAQVLAEASGWRGAYHWLGAVALVLLLPVLLLPWARIAAGDDTLEARAAAREGLTLAQALREPLYWGLFAASLFTAIGMLGVGAQVAAYLVDIGFAPLAAASAWGFAGMLVPIGMVFFGWLDGLIGRRRAVLLSYVVSMLGIALLWLLGRHPGDALLVLAVLLFGGTLGSRGPLIAAIAMERFRGPSQATIFGTISLGLGLGAGLGAWLGGVLHDRTGGYDAGLALGLAAVFAGMLPFLLVPALRR